jgi:hypothetical protein
MKNKIYIGHLNSERREVPWQEWGWATLMKDGSVMRQFDDDGKYTFIGEVDQSQVVMFTMYRLDAEDTRIDIIVPEGAKLIHKQRKISISGPNMFQRVYMFGYKYKGNHHFNYIMPSGQVVQSVEDNVHLPDFVAPINQ